MSATHILVVDDEPDIRGLVQEILEDEGYRVSAADSGNAARLALREDVHPRLAPSRRTRRSPTWERPESVSCFALFTMSVAGCRHPARQ
jgi:hypothetical protein